MVQANVGKNVLKSNILRLSPMTGDEYLTLLLGNPMQYTNYLSICYSASLTPPKVIYSPLLSPSFCFICYTPIENMGLGINPWSFSTSWQWKKLKTNQHMRDRLNLLAAILTQRWRPVASTKALNLLHWAMCAVLYRRTTAAIKMARKVGPFFHCYFVCCCHGGFRGNTEQVLPNGGVQWLPE